MDGTLFVALAQNQFSGGTLYTSVSRSAPMIVAPTSHPWRTHLPSIRHALLHQRYAISAPHVRYGKDKGFMGGTLFALGAYFNRRKRLSQQLRKRSSIHGLNRSISSRTALVGDPPPTLSDTRPAHDEETGQARLPGART